MQLALAEKSRTSWERAQAILAAQQAEWDWDYLRTRPDPLAPATLVDALQGGRTYDGMLDLCA